MQDNAAPALVGRRIIENVAKVMVGKTSVVEQALATLVAQGHILVEDVPGVGKTTLSKALANPSAAPFSGFSSPRICCPAM